MPTLPPSSPYDNPTVRTWSTCLRELRVLGKMQLSINGSASASGRPRHADHARLRIRPAPPERARPGLGFAS